MSGSRIIVEKLNYPPLQIVVTSNDGLGSLPPVSKLMYQLVGVGPLSSEFMVLVCHYSVVDRLVIGDTIFIIGKMS